MNLYSISFEFWITTGVVAPVLRLFRSRCLVLAEGVGLVLSCTGTRTQDVYYCAAIRKQHLNPSPRTHHNPVPSDPCSSALQSQTAVTAYFSSKQLLLSGFARQNSLLSRQTAVLAPILLIQSRYCIISRSFDSFPVFSGELHLSSCPQSQITSAVSSKVPVHCFLDGEPGYSLWFCNLDSIFFPEQGKHP